MAVFISRDADPLATAASITGNVATYGALSVGAPAADRIVIAVVSYEFAATATPVSCVIFTGVGDRATMDAGPAIQFSTTVGVAIFKRHYPAGSAASFDITFANAPTTTNHHVTIYDATGSTGLFTTSGTNTSTDMDVTTPLSIAITVPTNGEAIAVASCATDTGTHTWANMTSDLDVDAGAFRHVTGLRTTAGATTVTLTGNTNLEDGAMAIAVFSAGTIAIATKPTSIPAVPTPSEYPVSLRTWVNDPQPPFPPTSPPATYMPSRVREWGNWEDPRKPLTHIDFAAALRPQGTPPNTTHVPGRVTDWGMWERVPFSAAPFANLTLSLPAVAATYVFREPYYSPQWAGPRFETWTTAVNIALRAVAPPQRPFKQTDWSLTPAPRQPDRTFQRAFPPELVGQDRLPIRQQDWKLPVSADYSNSLRSFLARPGLPLITAPAVQPPFSQDDWPVPTAPYYDISLRTFIAINPPLLATSPPPPILMPPLIIEWGISDRIPFEPARIQYNAPLLTAPVPPRPFNQTDWPLTPAPRQPDRTFQRAFPPELVGQDRLPFRQQSWPVPISADYSVSLRSFLASPGLALITAPVVQAPFAQDDWPVPSAPRQPDRTFQRAFPPTLVGQDQFPIRQKDWPLPVPVAPINDLRTFIGQPQKQPVVIPFRQSDWPVPIATDFSNALRSIGFRSPALDVVAGRPFVQSNWPLTPAASQPDRTFQRSFPPALVGKDRLPIRQQDWPLPIAPRPASDLRTYIAQSPIRLIGKDRLPFRQMHWPVPLAPLEFHTLRSITQGRVIYGGEVAPIPPEPPLPPPEVIHSVRAHADAYYGVSYFDEIKGRADFSRAKGSNDEEAAN